MAADADALAERKAGLDISDRLVVAARDVATGHQIAGAARLPRLHAHHHGAHLCIALLHLHREVGDIGRAHYAGHAQDAAHQVVLDARRFGIRPLSVFLHHPEIGAAVAEQGACIIDHAAVDAGHAQRDADQQAQPEPGQREFLPRMQNVAPGQADHGAAPAGFTSASTTRIRLSLPSAFWL